MKTMLHLDSIAKSKKIVLIPLLIGFGGMIFSQYIFYLPVKSTRATLILAVTGLLVGLAANSISQSDKHTSRKLAASIFLGFLLIPYLSFGLGRVHVLAKDGPPEYIRVIEVRPTIETVIWITKNGEEKTVFQGPKTLYLHPGEQRVYLGTFSIPAGTYVRGEVRISNVLTDLEEDMFKAGVDPEYYEEEYQRMKEHLSDASDWSRNENLVRYTWDAGRKVSYLRMGEGFTYPGIGGPDITLDFIMGEHDGKPESVEVIMEMPPGIPAPKIGVDV
jgi:hypothetical protein